MIIGIGTDIVQIHRIERLLGKYENRFVHRILHLQEIEKYSILSQAKKASYVAKRFAGKESVAKAFGTGIIGTLQFNSIAILNDKHGKPFVNIDNISKITDNKYTIHISLSDDYPIASSFVIISCE